MRGIHFFSVTLLLICLQCGNASGQSKSVFRGFTGFNFLMGSPPFLSAAVTRSVYRIEKPDNGFDNSKIQIEFSAGNERVEYIAGILKRAIYERCEGEEAISGDEAVQIALTFDSGIGDEGYSISDGTNGSIRITGNDERGLLYGVGKFLRTSKYEGGIFEPGKWRGTSVPVCPVRGIYLATHFMNFYEAAPAEVVVEYLEDLALWGFNTCIVHFPTWQFEDIADSHTAAWLRNVKILFRAAQKAGIRIGLIQAPNQGFSSTPDELRGVKVPGNRRGNFGVNICPAKPGAKKLLMELYEKLLDEFSGDGLDYLIFWPYDEGGCACEHCWPWGGRGFLEISKEMAVLVREQVPGCRIVLSTWCFENEDDRNPDGEWAGLAEEMKKDRNWIDYIMADGHDFYFPKFPLEPGLPGDLPLLTFPEISMWGKFPWGGFGATPLPVHFQTLWDNVKGRIAGGTLYSEGIYEDINKALYAGFFWNPERTAEETLREYIAYEFSPGVIDETVMLIHLLEQNHSRRILETAEKALEIAEEIDKKLPEKSRQSWRWRILYLRSLIDLQLCLPADREKVDSLKKAYTELEKIYYTNEKTLRNVRPPEVKSK